MWYPVNEGGDYFEKIKSVILIPFLLVGFLLPFSALSTPSTLTEAIGMNTGGGNTGTTPCYFACVIKPHY